MTRRTRFVLFSTFFAAAFAATTTARGQQSQSLVLSLPLESQRATVGQRIGVTYITIDYHRPLVKGRKIWDGLVPYGEVWRAGANENTTLTVSDDVTVEGQPLPKGAYGLHMLPGPDSWTVIFSKNSTSWGSYSYDEKEDALRVAVKPLPSENHEALTYEFSEPAPDSVTLTMKWEKLAVPFRVAVDVKPIALASIRNQLRTTPGFLWEGWNDAATWSLENKVNAEEALRWVDRSIEAEERFENLQTKSQLLQAAGKTAEADAAMAKALAKANAQQLHNYARQLLTQKKTEEAVRIFQRNVQQNPSVWFVYAGLARAQVAKGDAKSAAKSMKEALARAPETQKIYVQGLVKRIEAGENIN